MKQKIIISLVLLFALQNCRNTKTSNDDDWVDLFNGKDLTDWIVKIHHYEVGENFDSTFRAKDGMIQVRYNNYGEYNDRFGHLYYRTPFSKFHLSLEYRFTGKLQQGAPDYTLLNSGVMFHSQDPRSMPKEQNWPISVEMQFLADVGDGNLRPTGNMCSPGTEIEYNGKRYDGHCLNSTSKTFSPDEWIKAELIVIEDSLIVHMINGDTVLQYMHPTMGGGVVNGYDSTLWHPGKALKSGYIALQSEGQPIDFRSIRIKQLK